MNKNIPIPNNEKERLEALQSYNILDTIPEAELDAITKLASNICKTPIALISILDESRQWFKSKFGFTADETPRSISFCQYAIMGEAIYEINDALKNELFYDNPFVTGDPNIRFYAGAPLIDPDGYKLGTLCVIDKNPRNLSDEQKESLQLLANSVVAQLRLHKYNAELNESKKTLNNFFRLSPDFMCIVDHNNKFLKINSSFSLKLGYEDEILLKESFLEFIHPDDIEKTIQEIDRMGKGESMIKFENRCRKKDGAYIWLSWNATPDPESGIIYATARDITDQIISNQILKQNEESLNIAQHLSKTGSWEYNVVDSTLNWSKELNNIFEMDETGPDQLFENFMKKIHPEDLTLIENAIKNSIENNVPIQLEYRIICNNSNIKILKTIGKIFTNNTDNKIWLKGTTQDVTESKRIELELIKTKEQAEQAVIIKNNFLANMSHEIRTPMNAIIGFTEILSQTRLNDEQQEFVGSVKTAGENLLSIINDILDFSKIESGNIIIENQPFKCKETINYIYNLLKRKAEEKKLEFNFLIDPAIPETLSGDSIRLSQVLINLVGNAIKFTACGSVNTTITKIWADDSKCKLLFSVKDTGIGIEHDKTLCVFERFIQADEDIHRKYGGSGLGLSISKKLIEMMDGELSLKSEFNKGTEFNFEIVFEIKTEAVQVANNPSNTTLKFLGQKRILVFEDNLLNQRLAKNVLTNFGFEVEISPNGEKGIEILKEKSFDIILMDIQMPDMDGYKATQIIRNQLNIKTPIIAMTAHAFVGEKEKCLSSGMNDFLSKPFKQDQLFRKLSDVLFKASENIIIDNNDNSKAENKFNLDYLKELSSGNADFEKEMIEIFITKVAADIESLKKAFESKDYKKIKDISHELISSLPFAGLMDLESLLKEIEIDAKNNILNSETLLKFEKVKSRLEECFPYLQEFLDNNYQCKDQ